MVEISRPWTRDGLQQPNDVLGVGKDLPIESPGETVDGEKPEQYRGMLGPP
jgi:hypothetical protein